MNTKTDNAYFNIVYEIMRIVDVSQSFISLTSASVRYSKRNIPGARNFYECAPTHSLLIMQIVRSTGFSWFVLFLLLWKLHYTSLSNVLFLFHLWSLKSLSSKCSERDAAPGPSGIWHVACSYCDMKLYIFFINTILRPTHQHMISLCHLNFNCILMSAPNNWNTFFFLLPAGGALRTCLT